MDNNISFEVSNPIGIKFTDEVEESRNHIAKNEKDAIIQLRNEFKAAIKDLRNDVNT